MNLADQKTLKNLFILFAFLIATFFVTDISQGQDLAVNTQVDIPVAINYSIYGDVFGVEGSSLWDSNQFRFDGVTKGNPFDESGFFFFGNETRAGVGEYKYAAAGAIPLLVSVDSTLYTLHLTTLTLTDSYTITHSFKFNENANAVRVKTGRIVNGTPVESESPNSFVASVTIYPNPTNHMTNVSFVSNVHGRVDVEVFDAIGRRIVRKNVNAVAGTNEVVLSSSDTAVGLNLVRVTGEDNRILTTSLIRR